MEKNISLVDVLNNISADIPSFVESVRGAEVNNYEQLEQANEFLAKIKARLKRVKEHKDNFCKPLRDQARKIGSEFDAHIKPLEELEDIIKGKMKQFFLYVESEKQKQLEEAKKKEEIAIVEAPAQNVRTEKATTSFKKVWTFEVTDVNKVPREFMMVDDKKVKEAIVNGEREIAGINIFQDINVSTRT